MVRTLRAVWVLVWLALFALSAVACHDTRRPCQLDCRARHDQCLLPASTREAIYACDAQASSCTSMCR